MARKVTISRANALRKIKKLARELARKNGHNCPIFVNRGNDEYSAWCINKKCNKWINVRIETDNKYPKRVREFITPELDYNFRGTALVYKCGVLSFKNSDLIIKK